MGHDPNDQLAGIADPPSVTVGRLHLQHILSRTHTEDRKSPVLIGMTPCRTVHAITITDIGIMGVVEGGKGQPEITFFGRNGDCIMMADTQIGLTAIHRPFRK